MFHLYQDWDKIAVKPRVSVFQNRDIH